MKRFIIYFFLLLMSIVFCSCAAKPMTSSDWKYEKDAIKIHLKSDPRLNLSEGMPHTLVICLYQLKEPNAFQQLAGNKEGMYKLLECDIFDKSVTASKRIIVHPGTDTTQLIARAEGAEYVALIAGYYELHKESMVRQYDVPVIYKRKGCLWMTKISKPGILEIDLDLGPHQIIKNEEIKEK